MKISEDKLQKIFSDLGINVPFIKGQDIAVKDCWHFYTDGQSVDFIFCDEEDFRNGMNRAFLTLRKYDVLILAFILMDTHVHFILYGHFEECNRYIHEYVRRTSIYIESVHGERNKFRNLPISHQPIDTDRYLKSAICYVIKNATVGGLPWMFYDYPWSSGPLYFRSGKAWTQPQWASVEVVPDSSSSPRLSRIAWKKMMKTRSPEGVEARIVDRMVFPGEYVAFEIVEKLFRSPKGFQYFVGSTKDSDIESRGGIISNLSLPDNEIRQHKKELCLELFGTSDTYKLDTGKRIHLARCLRSRYNSSPKQLARICGLKYEEVKGLLK